MTFRIIKIGILLIGFLFGIFFNFRLIFVSGAENLAEVCDIETIEKNCQSLSPGDCRKLLEKCEDYYWAESERLEKDIAKTAKEKKTLSNKVTELGAKIKKLNYQIQQNNLVIKDLGIQIVDTTKSIEKTTLKINESKEKLAGILRLINEDDQKGGVEILLSKATISGFFDNMIALEILNAKNKDILLNIKILKENLESQKNSLNSEKSELESVVKIQALQKDESGRNKQEQENYLKLTEQEYQKQVNEKKEKEKNAAEIRSRIFELIGVAKAPTFGEAYEIAKYAEKLTGIRPAFLLAILTQESRIGKNVGQCYLSKDLEENKKKRIMSPPNVTVFLEITKSLGRDPYGTPISCPMSYGWGGAMGPAQFIPATWAKYRDRVSQITGKYADPWNIRDAFLASALYLTDYGAAEKTYASEVNAALSYFAGPGWQNSKNKSIYQRDYGNPVMKIASNYESDIKALEAAGLSKSK